MPPYGVRYGLPSYEVCACCGFEFGNDDDPGTAAPATFDQYRNEWIEGGCEWFDPSKKPADWDAKSQLAFMMVSDDPSASNNALLETAISPLVDLGSTPPCQS